MSIYTMSGDTFLNTFINEDPRKVLNSKYIIISNDIKQKHYFPDQVVTATSKLFPSQMSLYLDYEENERDEFIAQYKQEIAVEDLFLSNIVREAVMYNETIILICSGREMRKIGHLKILRDYIYERFHYYVYDYKKVKKGKEKGKVFNPKEVLDICDEIKYSENAKLRDELNLRTKKELKKLLKDRNVSTKDMDKDDMITYIIYDM